MLTRKLLDLVFPEGLLLLVAVALVHWGATASSAAPVIRLFPLFVLAAGVLLGWRFQRGRLLLALLGLALADRAMIWLAPPESGAPYAGPVIVRMVAILLPVSLAALVAPVAISALVARTLWRPDAESRGFLWAAIGCVIAASAGRVDGRATLYLACAGLVLVVATVESAYAMAYHDELTRLPARRALNKGAVPSLIRRAARLRRTTNNSASRM